MFCLSKILALAQDARRIPCIVAMLCTSALALAENFRLEDSIPMLDNTKVDSLFSPDGHGRGDP
jgi:hypothetical protein